jgi:hypothetical protein
VPHVALFAYLAGRRSAILEVASNRGALIVGALLVLSAALARNYDQASLTNEPRRLLGPFAASLAISGPLFLTIYGIARWKGMESPGIGRAYLSFLGLYWMTAPLAWLYGIPYEAFLSPVEAVRANLWTLALVSAWRVALMVRVVSVVFNIRVRAAVPLVMLVADIAALTALHLVPQGRELARALRHAEGGLEQSLGPYSEATPDERAALEALVKLAGNEKTEPPARADRTSP